jgi:hypothetical protein
MAGRHSRASSPFSPPVSDDFNLIKGIGPAVERKLHEAGIVTFAQLAALSADQIAALIDRLSAKRIIHENWIGRAKQLAGPMASKTAGKKTAMPTQSSRRKSAARRVTPQHYATFTIELLLDEAGHVRRAVCAHHQSKDQETWNENDWDIMELMNYVLRKTGMRLLQAPDVIPFAQPESMVPTTPTGQPILPRTPESGVAPAEAQVSPASIETAALPTPDIRAAAGAEDFRAKDSLAEVGSTRAAETRRAGSRETLRLSGLTTMPTNRDHSSQLFTAATPFRVQLSVDLAEVKRQPDVPLDLVTNIYVKRLGGGSPQLIGQARDVANLTDMATAQVECPGLLPGDYRLEAEVSLTRHSGSSQSSYVPPATLKGGFLHIF